VAEQLVGWSVAVAPRPRVGAGGRRWGGADERRHHHGPSPRPESYLLDVSPARHDAPTGRL